VSRERDQLRLLTEVSLAGVTAAAVLGMHRLFADGSFRGPLLLQVALAHLCVALLRHARLRLALAGLVTVAAGLVCIAATQYLSTTWIGLPSPDTFSAIQGDVDGAWSVFRDVQAPAPVEPGFLVTTSIAIWVIAFIADWGAFRTGVSFEALLPPATLFLFAAVLGAEGGRAGGAAVFVAAAMLFVLLHRTWRQNRVGAWAMIQQRRGRWSVVGLGSTLSGIAVVLGAIAGPLLPGAGSRGIIPWQDIGDEDQTRVVVSPLVDIQARMVEQPDLQVFTVRTDDPAGAYWRLTALDDFNGQIWRSSYETDDADGELPSSIESPEVATHVVTQQITIQALAAIWLPAAFEPASIDAESAEVDYDDDSGTLIVDRDAESSDGLVYEVSSLVPTWTTEQLRSAPQEIPAEVRDRYLDLPADFSPRVIAEAERLTGDQPTAYDKAIALQDYLRSFDYDLQVQAGHDGNALENFLFQSQRGYCEQFAGAFAAMMRSIGVPSRVVVGFTKGDPDPYDEGLFRVKGKHAHAWVELYFPTYGWVTFDPTPTRGPPGGGAWLPNVEEQQVGTAPTPGDTSSTTAPTAGGGGPAQPPSETGDERPPEVDAGGRLPDDGGDDGGEPSFWDRIWERRWLVATAMVAYLLLVPTTIASRRWVRRRRAHTHEDQVRLAWREVCEELTDAGLQLGGSLTLSERAALMRRALPEMAPNIELMARAMEQVAYAEAPPGLEQVAMVNRAEGLVVAATRSRRPRWRRALGYVDIRRLFVARPLSEGGSSADAAPASTASAPA
jgi:transglutaminase-like putative cysteine protease